jgi:hypothetical protein
MSILVKTDNTFILDPRPAFSRGLQNEQGSWKLKLGQFNLSQPYFSPKRDMPQRAKRRKTEPSKTERDTLETFQSLQLYFEQCMNELTIAWPTIKDALCEEDDVDLPNNPAMIDFIKNAELVKVVKSFAFQVDPDQCTRSLILQGE